MALEKGTGIGIPYLEEAVDIDKSPGALCYASKPLILACDSSPVGIRAVLSHQGEDGSEDPAAKTV